ncbi:MAG: cytochrome c [Gammaproteobacteria bacterium]|nr:cytochrome c [Gammaproteobacteria bacterium]MDH3768365.1 cytochrome c [Gammaproteobacteria bacterium]
MTGLLRVCAMVCGLLFFSISYAEGDIEAGRIKAETCLGCHGIDGYNNVYPTYKVPKLAGQNMEYLVIALNAYKSGERSHPTMRSQAATLSAQDIDDIAAFLASGGEQ